MKAWKWLVALWITAVILAAFLYAGEARNFVLGASRIIFFHVPMAMVSAVAFLLAMIHAVRYLATRDPMADVRSETAAELGTLFCILATVTGSIFAKIQWNAYWHWDVRQTCILILLLIYGAYFGLRMAVDDPDRRAALASVYAVLAFFAVPFLMWIVPRMPAFETMHPNTVLTSREGLSPAYRIVLYSSFAGFCGLLAWLYDLQVRVRKIAMKRDAWLSGDFEAGPDAQMETKARASLTTGGG